MRPKLLDLFCCQGGTSMGYHQAGFEVTGVDIDLQPRYPFEFVQADAIEYVAEHGHKYDIIAASPPCQDYTPLRHVTGKRYPRLIKATRTAIKETGRPYIIENVPGARSELINPIMLCGSMFGLKVIRHRYFECSPEIWFSPATCQCRAMYTHSGHGQHSAFRNGATAISVAGHDFCVPDARVAMDIDWMTQKGLSQAIPPAYTKWLGEQMLSLVKSNRNSVLSCRHNQN